MTDKIKVIVIFSLAYTGSSWSTMVISSRGDTFNIGAGDRFSDLIKYRSDEICAIHGAKCPFWPRFAAQYDENENILVQIARYAQKQILVINNPSMSLFDRCFRDPRLDVRVVRQLRHGQATLASAMRHFPERVDSVYQAALAWLYKGTLGLERRIANVGGDALTIRYEDFVGDPAATLAKIGTHIDAPYTLDSLRFWEYEHHITGGNVGLIDNYLRMRGEKGVRALDGAQYYDDLLRHMRETNGVPKLDEGWRRVYAPEDVAAYDFVAGEMYEAYGYPRPVVDVAAQDAFVARHAPPATLAEAAKTVGPWRRPTTADAAARVSMRGQLRLYWERLKAATLRRILA